MIPFIWIVDRLQTYILLILEQPWTRGQPTAYSPKDDVLCLTIEFRVLPMEGKFRHEKIYIVAQQRSVSYNSAQINLVSPFLNA